MELAPTLLTIFDDLMGAGPFAPVFASLEAPDQAVNVLGQAEADDE